MGSGDIENKLHQKAAAREAARLQQEQEQAAAALQTERDSKQQAEQERVLELRQSIADVDSKTRQMQALLDELNQVHEQAKGLTSGAIQEKQELVQATGELGKLFAEPKFQALLAEERIYTVDDLLVAGDFAEDERVQVVKTRRESYPAKRELARGQIDKRGEAKRRAHKAITDEKPGAAPGLTYKDIVTALEELIQELGQEQKRLFYQTPEGQEALSAEILDRVRKRHKRPTGTYGTGEVYYSLTQKSVNKLNTVVAGDIEDGASYGQIQVKAELKNHFRELVDTLLAEKEEKEGVPALQKAVDTIEALPKRWGEIYDTLLAVSKARQETIDRLMELLGKDTNSPLFRQINGYGHWVHKDPERLATAFIDSNSSNNGIVYGIGMGTQTPEVILEKTISEQKALAEQIKRGNAKNIFSRSALMGGHQEHNYETRLENPERAAIILAEQAEFYNKFKAELTTPEELLAKTGGGHEATFYKTTRVKTAHALGFGDRGPVKSRLYFDGKTYAALCDASLPQIKARLQQQRQELATTAARFKEQVDDKVEADWADRELDSFHNARVGQNYLIYREAENILRMKQAAERLVPRLDLAVARLQGQMAEQVQAVENDRLNFTSVPEKDLQQLKKEITALQTEIQTIERDIDLIDQRAITEGDGLTGGKKRKRKEEKTVLTGRLETALQRLQEANVNYLPKEELNTKLGDIRAWLFEARREGLELTVPRGPVSLQEFIGNIKGQMNFQLTPEQSQIYEQYQALTKKQTDAAGQYQKKWGRL